MTFAQDVQELVKQSNIPKVMCVYHHGMGWVVKTDEHHRIFKTKEKLKSWLKSNTLVGVNPCGDIIK